MAIKKHESMTSVNLLVESRAGSHLEMMCEDLAEDRKEDRALVAWDFRLADQAEEADPETTEETEEIAKVSKVRTRTSAEAAVVGADEELEVQGTQAGQETQEGLVALEIPTEVEGEVLEAQCNIN